MNEAGAEASWARSRCFIQIFVIKPSEVGGEGNRKEMKNEKKKIRLESEKTEKTAESED